MCSTPFSQSFALSQGFAGSHCQFLIHGFKVQSFTSNPHQVPSPKAKLKRLIDTRPTNIVLNDNDFNPTVNDTPSEKRWKKIMFLCQVFFASPAWFNGIIQPFRREIPPPSRQRCTHMTFISNVQHAYFVPLTGEIPSRTLACLEPVGEINNLPFF